MDYERNYYFRIAYPVGLVMQFFCKIHLSYNKSL